MNSIERREPYGSGWSERRAAYLPPIGPNTTKDTQAREPSDADNGPMATGRIGTIGHEAARTETVPN